MPVSLKRRLHDSNRIQRPPYLVDIGQTGGRAIGTGQSRRAMVCLDLGTSGANADVAASLARWATDQFREVLVIINDGPHRLALMNESGGLTERAAAKRSQLLAARFLEQNERWFHAAAARDGRRVHFQQISVLQETPLYRNWLKRVTGSDHRLRSSIEHISERSAERRHRTNPCPDLARARKLAEQRLQEETAALCCLVDRGWDLLAFPAAARPFEDFTSAHLTDADLPIARLRWFELRLHRNQAAARRLLA